MYVFVCVCHLDSGCDVDKGCISQVYRCMCAAQFNIV